MCIRDRVLFAVRSGRGCGGQGAGVQGVWGCEEERVRRGACVKRRVCEEARRRRGACMKRRAGEEARGLRGAWDVHAGG
eukprot:1246066-Rhodomonas_salina.1